MSVSRARSIAIRLAGVLALAGILTAAVVASRGTKPAMPLIVAACDELAGR